jgi:hypothetical protein
VDHAALVLLPGRPTRSGLVLGYGGTNLPEIREGVRRLRDLLA